MGLNWQNLVWNNQVLTGSPRLLMLALADKCKDNSDSVEIDVVTLAYLARRSVKQTKRILHKLDADKFINFKPGNGRGHFSKIDLNKEILLQKKGDISDLKRGHSGKIKGDILHPNENKGGHSETIKGDISDPKGGHFAPAPLHPHKDIPPFTTGVVTTESEAAAPPRSSGEIADEIFGEPPPPQISGREKFLNECVSGLKLRLKTPKQLPDRLKWLEVIEFWYDNESTADNLLQIFDLKEEIRVLKDESWQMTPKVLEKNFGKLEALKRELEKVKNGANSNGSNNLSNRERREQSELDEIREIESVRARVEQRRAGKLS